MKKAAYIFILLIIASYPVKSQSGSTTDPSTDLRGAQVPMPYPDNYIEGTRNLYDDFRPGAVYYKGNSDVLQVPLRLNLYNNEFEYIKNDTLYALDNLHSVDRVVMDNQDFIYIEPDSEKDVSGFVVRWNAELPAVITEMKMELYTEEIHVFFATKPKRFERDEDRHYIMNSDLEFVQITSVKKLIDLLESHSLELKSYAKAEKISGRNPAEMAKILDYYRTLDQDF